MNFADLIARKQAGKELRSEEIAELIRAYTNGTLPDYQMSALLMAIYFQGMSLAETANLVKAMVASGRTVDLSAIPGRKVDKHSTGGVGDKISLIAAPIVASLGVLVPMISGRGLGHTGGTLDKLESIPGFTTNLTVEQFARQVGEIGCALIGQTDEIVPADRKMYALRDVTGTVRSIPLIASSILSKKIAEGADALLLDVKFGSGAVFSEIEDARRLALRLVEIGQELGLEVRALLTDMDQPLGQAVGNWLEVRECLQILKGEAKTIDLIELSLAQAAIMLVLGGKARQFGEGYEMASAALTSGRAYSKFIEIAQWQKAEISFLKDPELYPEAGGSQVLTASVGGYISEVNALELGHAAVSLGAGRRQKEDRIDYAAGLILHRKRGDQVGSAEPLVTLYATHAEKIAAVLPAARSAFKISTEAPPRRPLIYSEITEAGEKLWGTQAESRVPNPES